MVQFRRLNTTPALREYVHGYWDIQAGHQPEVLDLVPDGHPEIAIMLKSNIQLNVGEHTQFFPKIGLLGQLSERCFLLLNPGDRVIYVKLYPWTPFLLFRTPCSDLLNRVTDIEALTSERQFRQLVRDITNTDDILEISALLDAFFVKKLDALQQKNPFIAFAVRQIYCSSGTLGVEQLTSNIHASRRYVEKLFKTQIGMTPKQYARLIRVKKASLMLLNENIWESIGDVATELNYYDQSHFLKDFKAVARRTPSSFLRQQGNLSLDGVEAYLDQWDYS